MRQRAVVLVALSFGASLVGCGGGASREVSALRLATGAGQIRGTDVWNSVESIFPRNRVTYRENVVVNPAKKQLAITLQDTPAPYRVGEPGPGETSPLTFENAAKQLATTLGDSRKLIEGDLSYDDVNELTAVSAKVVLHAREAVRALELKKRELKPAAAKPEGEDSDLWDDPKFASEEDEARALVKQWMPRAKLIEYNATNLLAFSATHRKSGIEEWSAALLASCKELEETFARRRRRRPRIVTEAQEDGKGGPAEVEGEGPKGDPEEGPAKAATPGGEEPSEAGTGPSPVGKDDNPKPDTGPPQVGAFLLGVAGRRRSSRARSRRRAG